MSKEIDNQENLTLKKIRYYQGTIKDFDDFWNDKISQGESETSPETKACKEKNAELNKAFEIVPITADDENTQPEPLTKEEEKEVESEKCKKECDKKEKVKEKENIKEKVKKKDDKNKKENL